MTEVEKCRIIYQGSKLFWRTRNTIDVTIVDHCNSDVTEVIAYEPSINVEAERIYLNSNILRTKLDQVHIDSKFSFAKQNNVPISTEFTDSVMNHAITDFVIPRLIISEFAREELRFVVNLEFRSSDGDNVDELVCAKAAAVVPFQTKNHKLLAPGEVEAALNALEEEKRALDVSCAQAAVLEAEAHAPLSSKQRWRIPIVLIKMDKGKILSAGDAKIWASVSKNLKTQADIERATDVTVQSVTSPVQLAAEKAAKKPFKTFRQVVEAFNPHQPGVAKAVVGPSGGAGADARSHDARAREKNEVSFRRPSSPRGHKGSEFSGRISATPCNSSRLLAGTAASQARTHCAAEDNHPAPKIIHKKPLKRASSRNGHSNNTSKRSLRISANSESHDNSDPCADLCASPDADHSGILDCSSPLGVIGENARAGFVNQVTAGLSSFAASFSAKNKAPAASENVSKDVNEEAERTTVLAQDEGFQAQHSLLKPSVETDKAAQSANVRKGRTSGTRRSYFGALLSTLVRGDSGEQASLVGRATSSESLANGDKATEPSMQDLSLSKKPTGVSSWLPWRPFKAAAVVPTM